MRFYQTQDMSIGQVMRPYKNEKSKEDQKKNKKLAPKTSKPSKPMFMTYYVKLQLVIFALLGEIKIVQVKQNGQKKTF